MRIQIFTLLTVSWLALTFTFAQERTTKKAAVQESLVTAEGNYVIKDFHFIDGESLPELTLHYQTIGQPVRNPSTGEVENAILLIHGTTKTGEQFLAKTFEMRCSNPGSRSMRPSTTSSYRTRSDLAVRVSLVMGCVIGFPAMATEIWWRLSNGSSPRVSASNICG